MINSEFRKALIDRFEGFELVEYLDIDIEDVISAFIEEVTEAQDDLEEFMIHGR